MSFLQRIEHRDAIILRLINSSLKCSALDILMPIITYFGSGFVTIPLCAAAILNKNAAVHKFGVGSAWALSISYIISEIIKITVNRLRPFLKMENLNIKKIGIDKYSFPSGHTTAAFSIGIMGSLFFPPVSVIFISTAFAIGISRMYLGVHYPTDVFAGSILGSITSICIFLLM
ncbi:MAG: phosphatase family protein [Clostridiaceae bacterium]|jgi:undecaprenyl-diphosphatase|nr:phosphatase family protein [Clostridiaceae bacterium]